MNRTDIKRVLFFMTRGTGRYGKPSTPPVGIAYLATFLRGKGYETAVVDLRVEEPDFDYIKAINDFGADAVGVSFMSNGYKMSYALIDDIKKRTGAMVIIGGPHVSTLRGKIMEECPADYAVYREGEYPLLELLKGDDPAGIKNLIWRRDGRAIVNEARDPLADPDSLPFPDYEMFPMEKYGLKRIPINTARGCPNLCTYCAMDLVVGRTFMPRSPGNVVDEIEYWYKKGYRDFGFNDSTFTQLMKRAEAIADEILRRGIKIEWDLRTGIRVDRVNPVLLTKLKSSGCNFIAFGIESVDEEVLKAMRKGTNYKQITEALTAARDAGIGVGGFFMIGTPEDTYERFRKSYEFADQDIFEEVRFYNTEPYPGTEMFDWIKKNGRFLFEPEEYLNSASRWDDTPIFETDAFTKEERKKAFNESQYLVAKKLIVKVAGKVLAPIIYVPCRIKPVRDIVLFLGFQMAPLILKAITSRKKKGK